MNPFRIFRRPEQTSKEVASRASWLMKSGDIMLQMQVRQLRRMEFQDIAEKIDAYRVAAKSVAASALGQARDKGGK